MRDQNQKENHEIWQNEAGNALIYVLVAIALFAALTFTIGKQTDSNESSNLNNSRSGLYAAQLIAYAAQAKSAIDQMTFSGLNIDDLDFSLPGTAGFTGGVADFRKVYHPQGGGLIARPLPPETVNQTTATPPANWYLGMFNNTEWTKTTTNDVMLAAFQISQGVCEEINSVIIGNTTIPVVTGSLDDFFVDVVYHSGSNSDLDIADCAGCDDNLSMCVSNAAGSRFVFYNIIIAR